MCKCDCEDKSQCCEPCGDLGYSDDHVEKLTGPKAEEMNKAVEVSMAAIQNINRLPEDLEPEWFIGNYHRDILCENSLEDFKDLEKNDVEKD